MPFSDSEVEGFMPGIKYSCIICHGRVSKLDAMKGKAVCHRCQRNVFDKLEGRQKKKEKKDRKKYPLCGWGLDEDY